MNAHERQRLWNQAREAKETLSTADQTTIVLPPGFLGKDDIVINRIRRYIAGRFVEYYRVLDEKAAGVREVEVYGLAENP